MVQFFIWKISSIFMNYKINEPYKESTPGVPPPPDFNDLDICCRVPKTKRHVFFLICQ